MPNCHRARSIASMVISLEAGRGASQSHWSRCRGTDRHWPRRTCMRCAGVVSEGDAMTTVEQAATTPEAGWDVLAADGSVIRIRPVRDDDEAALAALNDRVSDRSMYL